MAEDAARRRALTKTVAAWFVAAALIGVATGLCSVVLSAAVLFAAKMLALSWVFGWLLPVGGLVTYAVYAVLRVSWRYDTNQVVAAANTSQTVNPVLAPAIVFGTTLTNMCGGSVGKEAATLQLGGALGSGIGHSLKLRARLATVFGASDCEGTFVLCGMAGAFSALLFAPLCSTLFVIELARTHADIKRALAVLVAAIFGYAAARPLAISYPWLNLYPMDNVGRMYGGCIVVALAATAMGVVFCLGLRALRGMNGALFSQPLVKIAVLGVVVVVAAHVLGVEAFAGTGAAQISAALHGTAGTWDFAGKLLMSTLVLGAGFKGGELTPSMAIGACTGCTVGTLLGADPAACAGVGLVAIFSATTNTPLASFLLGVEAFGLPMAPYCAIAAAIGFFPTIRLSLYACNRIPGYGALWATVRQTFGGLPRW